MGNNTNRLAAVFRTMGASSHSAVEREQNDFYATEPKAVEMLLGLETFAPCVWEVACGQGHISKVLEKKIPKVISTDLVNRGFGTSGIDFLKCEKAIENNVDIITNPPYKYAQEFVEKALELVEDGHKVAMFLKITFLEGKARKAMFEKYPPKTVYVSSSRLNCAKNGRFDLYTSSAMCHAWFVWEKGYQGETVVKWFN